MHQYLNNLIMSTWSPVQHHVTGMFCDGRQRPLTSGNKTMTSPPRASSCTWTSGRKTRGHGLSLSFPLFFPHYNKPDIWKTSKHFQRCFPFAPVSSVSIFISSVSRLAVNTNKSFAEILGNSDLSHFKGNWLDWKLVNDKDSGDEKPFVCDMMKTKGNSD